MNPIQIPSIIRKTPSSEDNANHSQQTPLTEEEAGDLLEEALSSPDPYPVNLDWLVPLLHYKHISSLTTHLKRHFEKDVDYKKCTVGAGVRAYTYQITIKCFKKICTKARHASRKQVAIYWIKTIDKKAGGVEPDEETRKRRPPTKRVTTGAASMSTLEGTHSSNAFEEDEDLDVEEDDEDDVDYSPYPHNKNNTALATTANHIDADSDIELDNSSSAYLRSLRHQPFSAIPATTQHTPTSQVLGPMSTLALFNAATAPPMQRKKDFSNVNILSRKRRQIQDEPWAVQKKDHRRAEDVRVKEKVSHTRSNLRMLSQLALGLR